MDRRRTVDASLALSVLGLALGGCGALDDAFCPNANCGWSDEIQSRISQLSGLPDAPPADTSNKYSGIAAAQKLGQQFFWNTRFSGTFDGLDSIKRPVPYGRVARGQPHRLAAHRRGLLQRGHPPDRPGRADDGRLPQGRRLRLRHAQQLHPVRRVGRLREAARQCLPAHVELERQPAGAPLPAALTSPPTLP